MKKKFNPKELGLKENYHLMISGIIPRPIAFVTSLDEKGNINLAPFSFFNGFGANPPIVGFSPALSGRTGEPKDTLLNIQETQEFTISIINYGMVGQASLSSCEYERDIDEYLKSGLNRSESTIVKPPFVEESPFVMECKLHDIITLGGKPGSGNLILGEIVMFHVSDNVLDNNNRVDPYLLDTVSRLGASWYSRSKDGIFELKKPRWNGIGFENIPKKIFKSKIITANELAVLASVDHIPDQVQNIYDKFRNESFQVLENLCKDFISENKLSEAWTILSIIDED